MQDHQTPSQLRHKIRHDELNRDKRVVRIRNALLAAMLLLLLYVFMAKSKSDELPKPPTAEQESELSQSSLASSGLADIDNDDLPIDVNQQESERSGQLNLTEVSNVGQVDDQYRKKFSQAQKYLNKKQYTKAIEVYKGLIDHDPYTIDGYINLAAAYAKNKQLDKAEETLVAGLNSQNKYAVLYQNLQKVHGEVAAQAYRQALGESLSNNNGLDLAVLEASSLDGSGLGLVAVKKVEQQADAQAKQQVEALAKQQADAQAKQRAEALAQADKRKVQQKLKAKQNQAIGLVKSWAKAWAAQNVSGYIGHYENNYQPTNKNLTHKQWREQRRQRLTGKSYIKIAVSNFKVQDQGESFAVTFIQNYRSNTVKGTVTKRLVFNKHGDDWRKAKIIDEKVVGR